jgi:hypothetical protein
MQGSRVVACCTARLVVMGRSTEEGWDYGAGVVEKTGDWEQGPRRRGGGAVPRPVADGRPAAYHRSARGGIAVLVPWREKGSGSGEPAKKGRGVRRRGRSRTAGMLQIRAGGRQPELDTARRHRKLGKVGAPRKGG